MRDYPFVPAYWDDYGPRAVTLALMLHMAEGGGTVGFLDKHGTIPPRGVSVHFVCESTGRIVQMLPLHEASGSLNPNDRSTDKPYYSHDHLVDVLGEWWRNPNEAVISIEIEGFARTGPNGRQAKALVDWAADMVKRYPTIRGALGHADQTNTKACPGTTAAMRAVFASIGGHGLWTEEDVPGLAFTMTDPTPGRIKVKNIQGVLALQLADREAFAFPPGAERDTFGKGVCDEEIGGSGSREGYLIGDELAVIPAGQVVFTPDTLDCAGPIGAQRERDRVASLAAIEEVFAS